MDKEKIGKLIQTRRKEKGLSQKELAELIQVSTATVSKWETYVNLPDIAILEKIAEALGIPLTNFFDSVDSAGETKPAFNSREPCTEETSASTITSAENDLTDLPQEAPPDAASSRTKSRWPKQLAFATGILLLIGIAITCSLTLGKKEDIFSPEICEEYAGDYEGQNAYYIIVESSQSPTDDELNGLTQNHPLSRLNFHYSPCHSKFYSTPSNNCPNSIRTLGNICSFSPSWFSSVTTAISL